MMLLRTPKHSLHRWIHRSTTYLVLTVLGLLLIAAPSWAQYIAGSIKGIVTDAANHRIVGAAVQATSVDTGLSRNLSTDSNGEYNFE